MKITYRPRHARRTTALARAQLLARYERRGVSAAAFARPQRIPHPTFCRWRRCLDQTKSLPAFGPCERPAPPLALGRVGEWGAPARRRHAAPDQFPLAAPWPQPLNAPTPC